MFSVNELKYSSQYRSLSAKREKMWLSFYQFRISKEYSKMWDEFFQSVDLHDHQDKLLRPSKPSRCYCQTTFHLPGVANLMHLVLPRTLVPSILGCPECSSFSSNTLEIAHLTIPLALLLHMLYTVFI